MATLLVELGANPNQPSAKGCTPMHEAAKFSSEHVTQMLLAAGGNARQLDSHGYTPNSYATHVGNSDVSRILPDDQTTSWDHFKTTLDYRERLHILNMRGGTKKKKGGKKGKKKKNRSFSLEKSIFKVKSMYSWLNCLPCSSAVERLT